MVLATANIPLRSLLISFKLPVYVHFMLRYWPFIVRNSLDVVANARWRVAVWQERQSDTVQDPIERHDLGGQSTQRRWRLTINVTVAVIFVPPQNSMKTLCVYIINVICIFYFFILEWSWVSRQDSNMHDANSDHRRISQSHPIWKITNSDYQYNIHFYF